MSYTGLLPGHDYMYDLDWLVRTVKRHTNELAQIDQKIKDAVEIELSDERIQSIVENIISNLSGVVNVKTPPGGLTPAVGDGTQDDTAAIQAAINYVHEGLGRGIIFFPPGQYLTSDLTLYDNIGIIGQGRYSTILYGALGSKAYIVGGDASGVSIANIGIDGNAGNQVNHVDGVDLTGRDYLISNIAVKNAYNGMTITLTDDHFQADNVEMDGFAVGGISLSGGSHAQLTNVEIKNVSSTTGQFIMDIASDYSTLRNIRLDSNVPVGLQISGNMCVFDGYISATMPFSDTGNSNTIIIWGTSKKEVFNGSAYESVGGSKYIATGQDLHMTVAGNYRNDIDGQLTEVIKGSYVQQSLANTTEISSGTKELRAPSIWINGLLTYSSPLDNIDWNELVVPVKESGSSNIYYLGIYEKTKSRFLIINPLNNGAVGDGVTDDSGAMRTCMNLALALKIPIYLPDGYTFNVPSEPLSHPEIEAIGNGKFKINNVIMSWKYWNTNKHDMARKWLLVRNNNFDNVQPGQDYYEPGDNTPFTYQGVYYNGRNGGDSGDGTFRTGWSPFYISVHNNGKGDCECMHLNAIATQAGISSKYYVPACVFINGDIYAANHDVYLNPFEFNHQDNGNADVCCIGYVGNFARTKESSNIYRKFIGWRLQNHGTVACDAAYQATGGPNNYWSILFDATRCQYSQNAVAMTDGQQIRWGFSPEGWLVTTGLTDPSTPKLIHVTPDGMALQLIYGAGKLTLTGSYCDLDTAFFICREVHPAADNVYSMGAPTLRWTQVYSATTAIDTSDERAKDEIQDINEKLYRAWDKVSYKQFKFKDAIEKKGDKARTHIGLIAQDIIKAFESEGLNAFDYGLVCYDEAWTERIEKRRLVKEAEYEGDHCIKSAVYETYYEEVNHPDIYSVRYAECECLEAAYIRWKLNKVQTSL